MFWLLLMLCLARKRLLKLMSSIRSKYSKLRVGPT